MNRLIEMIVNVFRVSISGYQIHWRIVPQSNIHVGYWSPVHLYFILFLFQETAVNKNIQVIEASGRGVYGGHINPMNYI